MLHRGRYREAHRFIPQSVSIADLAVQNPGNLIDIVFDSECYQSCDSFPSVTGKGVQLESIAKGCGIKNALTIRTLDEFESTLDKALNGNELFFIVVKVERGEDLVTLSQPEGRENKYRFL